MEERSQDHIQRVLIYKTSIGRGISPTLAHIANHTAGDVIGHPT